MQHQPEIDRIIDAAIESTSRSCVVRTRDTATAMQTATATAGAAWVSAFRE